MENLFTFFSKLRKKEIYPKLYIFNLHLERNGVKNIATKLCVEVDYRYEDALLNAKKSFKSDMDRKNFICDMTEMILGTWVSYEMMDLFSEHIDSSIEPVKDVNSLIREIKANKSKFSKEEKLLIRDILQIDKIKEIECEPR